MVQNTARHKTKHELTGLVQASWLFIASLILLVLLSIFVSRVNATLIQKIIVGGLSVASIWQYARHKNSDLFIILLASLGILTFYSLYRSESIPVLVLIILVGLLATFLTYWQGHRQYEHAVLLRHSYIIGFLAAQISMFFAYWVGYDDILAKAILSTLLLYCMWGVLDVAAHGPIVLRSIAGYIGVCVLLATIVLATMKPLFS